MLNSQQNIMPYAMDMVNDLPTSMGINNANIPALAPNMLTPMNNVQSFMPTMQNMQGTYADGGYVGNYDEGGTVGIEALLSQMSQEELEALLAHSQGNLPPGQQERYMFPHYKKGGFLKKPFKAIKKAAKFVAPLAGGVVGSAMAGPLGGAIGSGIGSKLAGAKTKQALLSGLGGYLFSGGFGPMSGAGSLMEKLTPAALTQAVGRKAPDMIPSSVTGTSGISSLGLGNIFGGKGLESLLLPAAIAGTVGRKVKTPKEPSLTEHMKGFQYNWGPEQMGRRVKPLERVQKILDPNEGLFYEDVNPETQYYAHGGYLDGDTGGQADEIPAKLSDGEYVLSADVVSHLGDGNNVAGAKKLDAFMRKVRHHRMKSGGKLPPKALGIEAYLGRAS